MGIINLSGRVMLVVSVARRLGSENFLARLFAHLALRWRGGARNEISLTLPRSRPATVRTDEDTIAPLRRLAAHCT